MEFACKMAILVRFPVVTCSTDKDDHRTAGNFSFATHLSFGPTSIATTRSITINLNPSRNHHSVAHLQASYGNGSGDASGTVFPRLRLLFR